MIILGIILMILGEVVIALVTISEDSKNLISCLTSIAIINMGSIIIATEILSSNNSIPTAMDVYEGRTTLKIEYIDSIPIDSIVVFKNDYK